MNDAHLAMPADFLSQLFRLEGRTALVCGAARGLGWEIARALGHAGAAVVIAARSQAQLGPRLADLAAEGIAAAGIAFDMHDTAALTAEVGRIVADRGAIDIVVNAVGARDRRPARDISIADFARLVEVDLVSAYALAKAVLPAMQARNWGRIVMLTSIVDRLAVPGAASYIAAKGGLAALVRALAAEYGRKGVTCNALSPGFFATETNLPGVDTPTGRDMAVRVPLGRWAQPDEIAGAALFLCSPAASYVNGHTLVVDGGVSATYAMPRGPLT